MYELITGAEWTNQKTRHAVFKVWNLSADNVCSWEIVWKMNIWLRSNTFRANVKCWGQSLNQGHYQLTSLQVRRFMYFVTLSLILILHIDSKLCRLFMFFPEQHVRSTLSLDSSKLACFPLCIKRNWDKKVKLEPQTFFWQKQLDNKY